jgi:hypothetical protein
MSKNQNLKHDDFVKSSNFCVALHPRPVKFSLRETAKPI